MEELRQTVERTLNCYFNLDKYILLAPEERDPHEPVLAGEQASGVGPPFWGEDASPALELRTNDFPAHGAGSDANFRLVADAFVFPGVAAGHYAEFAIFFREPHRGGDGDTGFSKGNEADVFLAADVGGNGSGHENQHIAFCTPIGFAQPVAWAMNTGGAERCYACRECVTHDSCANGCAIALSVAKSLKMMLRARKRRKRRYSRPTSTPRV